LVHFIYLISPFVLELGVFIWVFKLNQHESLRVREYFNLLMLQIVGGILFMNLSQGNAMLVLNFMLYMAAPRILFLRKRIITSPLGFFKSVAASGAVFILSVHLFWSILAQGLSIK
jgi:hypothetical protein